MQPEYLKFKEAEVDRAIEAKKRMLLAQLVGREVSGQIEPFLNRMNILLENDDTAEKVNKKLDELKELLATDIEIEI